MAGNGSESRYLHFRERSADLRCPFHECINGHFVDLPILLCPTCYSPVQRMTPCRHAQFGCPRAFADGETSIHLEECGYTRCPCPFMFCDFSGTYCELYCHAKAVHSDDMQMISCGVTRVLSFVNRHRLVLKEDSIGGGEIIVVDHYVTPNGARFYVRCIAPKVPEMGNFSWLLTYRSINTLSSGRRIINRVNNVNGELSAMYVHILSYMSSATDVLICIDRVDIEEELGEAPVIITIGD